MVEDIKSDSRYRRETIFEVMVRKIIILITQQIKEDYMYPSSGFCCWAKPWSKSNLERSIYFSLQALIEGETRQEAGGRNWSRGMVEHCLMVCSSWLTQSTLHTTQDHIFRDSPTHKWAGSSHINHESRKCPIDMHAQSDGGNSST